MGCFHQFWPCPEARQSHKEATIQGALKNPDELWRKVYKKKPLKSECVSCQDCRKQTLVLKNV